MQRSCLQQEEQQELWHTLEILMHGKTAAEVRSAQQRLETMRARLLPHLSPATQQSLTKVLRAAACASHGGEQRFYWLAEVENHWRGMLAALGGPRSRRGGWPFPGQQRALSR